MKDEILGLPEEEKRDLAALQDTARERQKQKFLEGFLLMLPLFPALALRVKWRYGPLVLKRRQTLPDGALSKLEVLRSSDPCSYRLESKLRTPFCVQAE